MRTPVLNCFSLPGLLVYLLEGPSTNLLSLAGYAFYTDGGLHPIAIPDLVTCEGGVRIEI